MYMEDQLENNIKNLIIIIAFVKTLIILIQTKDYNK